MHLDSHSDALVLDHLDKGCAIISSLVQCLMEEDNATNAAVDAVISGEQNLAVLTSILLGVFNANLVEALSHATCVVLATSQDNKMTRCLYICTYVHFAFYSDGTDMSERKQV